MSVNVWQDVLAWCGDECLIEVQNETGFVCCDMSYNSARCVIYDYNSIEKILKNTF